jgi:hypothetical protein
MKVGRRGADAQGSGGPPAAPAARPCLCTSSGTTRFSAWGARGRTGVRTPSKRLPLRPWFIRRYPLQRSSRSKQGHRGRQPPVPFFLALSDLRTPFNPRSMNLEPCLQRWSRRGRDPLQRRDRRMKERRRGADAQGVSGPPDAPAARPCRCTSDGATRYRAWGARGRTGVAPPSKRLPLRPSFTRRCPLQRSSRSKRGHRGRQPPESVSPADVVEQRQVVDGRRGGG